MRVLNRAPSVEASMMHASLRLFLAAALATVPAGLPAQPAPADPDVIAGVKQVDEGEYDKAILTLDNAARRLAGDPAKVGDLSQAYLYLGIAYIGKGHEAAARAKFREALRQSRDLILSPEKYPPKVIDAFEAAKQEEAKAPAIVAKKGGSKKGLVIGGLVAAGAAAAVAVGAGGGGGGGDSGASPNETRTSRTASGSLADQQEEHMIVTASRAGTLEATLTWQDPTIRLNIFCQEQVPPYNDCGSQDVRLNDTTVRYTVSVTQKEYLIIAANFTGKTTPEPFTLTVLYP